MLLSAVVAVHTDNEAARIGALAEATSVSGQEP